MWTDTKQWTQEKDVFAVLLVSLPGLGKWQHYVQHTPHRDDRTAISSREVGEAREVRAQNLPKYGRWCRRDPFLRTPAKSTSDNRYPPPH